MTKESNLIWLEQEERRGSGKIYSVEHGDTTTFCWRLALGAHLSLSLFTFNMELTTRNNSGQVDRKCFNMNSFFSFKIVLMVAYFIVITGGIVTTYRTFHLENVDIPEVSNSQEVRIFALLN